MNVDRIVVAWCARSLYYLDIHLCVMHTLIPKFKLKCNIRRRRCVPRFTFRKLKHKHARLVSKYSE